MPSQLLVSLINKLQNNSCFSRDFLVYLFLFICNLLLMLYIHRMVYYFGFNNSGNYIYATIKINSQFYFPQFYGSTFIIFRFLEEVQMEDVENLIKKIPSSYETDTKFQHQWHQGFKDTIQLENRIKILEIEKQRKIKDIQKKLNTHKKFVELKILKHQRHQDVSNLHQKEKVNVSTCYSRFQSEKKKRSENIKSLKLDIIHSKNKQFWNVKRERDQINRKIIEQRIYDKQVNLEKRNRVRLMQIEAKQNVVSSWNRRLSEMKQNKQKGVQKKAKQHEQNLLSIAKLTKVERKMLQQIYKAENMQKQLSQMIENEAQMNGEQLSNLYTTIY